MKPPPPITEVLIMLTDLLCFLRYGKTRFGLMEHYNISILRVAPGYLRGEWLACSSRVSSNFTHNGVSVTNRTAYGALISCVELIKNSKL